MNRPFNWREPTRVRQRGSSMVEFAIAGPLLTVLGTVLLQYVLMFSAKNFINHATFMGARAGSMSHASLQSVEDAYARALVPLYGGGLNSAELAQSFRKAQKDLQGNLRIELINPTRESFDDWASAHLRERYGRRAIPKGGLAQRSRTDIGPTSGQNIQDANLIKLRITHGYELKVPLAGTLMQFVMRALDKGQDDFASGLYQRRRIPLVSHATLHMFSDAIEPEQPVSIAGLGNRGKPVDPGFDEGPGRTLPMCGTAGCSRELDKWVPGPDQPVPDKPGPESPGEAIGCY